MADYSFNPQFSNLANLQPLQPIDVTRGGSLQFQPLQPIQVASSQPELVAQSIAGAVSNIAKGALGGITANFEKKEEEEMEKRKFAHELMLYGVKQSSENENFLEKEEARFISENSGKPNFAKKLSEFKAAQNRLKDTVPDRPQKQDEQYEVVEPPLPELEAEFVTPPQEIPQEPALSAIPVSTTGQPTAAPLAGVSIPQQVPQPEQKVEQKPLEGMPPNVDYTKHEQPKLPSQRFETETEAQNAASELNKTLNNPDWQIEVEQDKDGFSLLKPKSVRKERIQEEQSALDLFYKAEQAKQKAQEAEEKSGKITKANVNQYKMQLDQAAASVREINDLIKLIEENKYTAVGGWSKPLLFYPGNNAAKMARGMIKTIHSNVAFNALMELKKASPTGGAGLGALTEGEREALASTEGSFDLDNLPSDAILPRLEQLRQARLKLIDIAGKQIKDFDPEFKTPTLSYDKKKKKKASKTKSGEDMVSVISPDGKSGKIPRSQLAAAIAEGYKAQ
jgi:hypothetical protein